MVLLEGSTSRSFINLLSVCQLELQSSQGQTGVDRFKVGVRIQFFRACQVFAAWVSLQVSNMASNFLQNQTERVIEAEQTETRLFVTDLRSARSQKPITFAIFHSTEVNDSVQFTKLGHCTGAYTPEGKHPQGARGYLPQMRRMMEACFTILNSSHGRIWQDSLMESF